jgi:uncharacterized protein (TIGR01244 family)
MRLSVMGLALVALAACAAPEAERRGPSPEPASPAAGAGAGQRAEKPPEPETLLRNGMMPFEGILTGGQPTPQQLEAARNLGYKTVINMRMPDEEGSTRPEEVEGLGMTYISIPIGGEEGVNEENTRRFAEALENAEYPIIVHCASGNRIGALFAMKGYLVDGMPADEALAIGLASGLTRLEPVIREKLGLQEAAE